MRRTLLAALLVASGWSGLAQEKLAETIEVRVLNVDVVVRDRAGRPVTGLTKDDFEIWDNGRKQLVTNSYEVRGQAPAPPAAVAHAEPASEVTGQPPPEAAPTPADYRQRKIVIFIDNYSLPPLRRNQILKSLQKFIDTRMRSDDEAMVVVWQHSARVVTQFTADRDKLRDAVSSVAGSANASTSAYDVERVKRLAQDYVDSARLGRMTWAAAYRQATLTVNAYAEEVTGDASRLLRALGDTAAALSGVEGRKALLFVGAEMPEKPGIELYSYVYSLFSRFMRLEISSDAIMGRNNHVSYSIRKAAERAASAGVTFYVIDAADTRDSISAENIGDYSGADNSLQYQAYANGAMAFNNLSRITGGMALVSENFDAAFNAVSLDLSAYYSLGYRPSDDAPGRQHKLVVKAKNHAYVVRARESYTAKGPQELLDDRVTANIVTPLQSGWPVEIAHGQPRKDGGQYRVPVLLSLAPAALTLLPRNGTLAGGFTVSIVVGTSDGRRSQITKIPQSVEIAPEGEQQLRSKPITFGALVMMTPGTNLVSVAVTDQVTNVTGFARASIVLQ